MKCERCDREAEYIIKVFESKPIKEPLDAITSLRSMYLCKICAIKYYKKDKMAKYTKKDYELVAKSLGEAIIDANKKRDPSMAAVILNSLMQVRNTFLYAFKEDNPKFDVNKFKTKSLGG